MGVESYNLSASLNTSLAGINIADGMARDDVNNAIRQQLSDTARAIGTAAFGSLPGGSTNSLDTYRSANAAPDGTTQWYGTVHRIHLQGTNPWNYGRSHYLGVHLDGTGVVTSADVLHGYVWLATGASLANGQGLASHLRIDTGASLTNEHDYFRCVSGTYAGTASAVKVVGYSVGDIGDATRVQNVVGLDIPNLLASTSTIGIKADMAASASTWFIYSSGAAQSVISGNIRIGSVVAPTEALDVTGNIRATGEITSTGLRIGYSAGAGGAVTQLTSKSTGVTLNKVTGQITLNAAALAGGANVTFTVTDSAIASTDVIILNLQSGAASDGTYDYRVGAVSTGSFKVTLENRSGGSLAEALVFNYAAIKGFTS